MSNSCPQPNLRRLSLRVWSDEATDAAWKSSVKDINGEILCVSQFTLMANTTKGNKPDFHRAMVSMSRQPVYKIFKLYLILTGARNVHGYVRNRLAKIRTIVLTRKDSRYVSQALHPSETQLADNICALGDIDGKFGAMMNVSLTNDVSFPPVVWPSC